MSALGDDRTERRAEKLDSPEHRLRIVSEEGVFVVYNAPTNEEGRWDGRSYLAYWHDAATDKILVWDRLIWDRSDMADALASLRRRFTGPGNDLARQAEDAGWELSGPLTRVDIAGWISATRGNVLRLTGVWNDDPPLPDDETLVIANPGDGDCNPCAVAGEPPEDWMSEDPWTIDVYNGAMAAACNCCNAPDCPRGCPNHS